MKQTSIFNDITISDEEAEMYSLISIKISCATCALKQSVIPEDATPEQIERFLNNVISIKAGYDWLKEDWWFKIKNKYGLEQSTDYFYDSITRKIKLGVHCNA